MKIVRLDLAEAQAVGEDLIRAAERGAEVLVSVVGPPQERAATFKIKIGGNIWSPPMGTEIR